MADSAAAAASSGGFWGSFFDWSNLSSVVNVLGFILLGISVPLFNMLKNFYKRKKEQHTIANDKHILEITKTVTDPILTKIANMDDALQGSARTSNAVLETLEQIQRTFKEFKDCQEEFQQEQRVVNNKVDYIDKVFQDNLSFGARDPSSPRRRKPHE